MSAERDAAGDLLQLQDEEEARWAKIANRKYPTFDLAPDESPSPSPPPSIGGSSR